MVLAHAVSAGERSPAARMGEHTMISVQVSTCNGVTRVDQPSGFVEIIREDGSSVVTLCVGDNDGSETTVFMDHHSVTRLMMALGASALDI